MMELEHKFGHSRFQVSDREDGLYIMVANRMGQDSVRLTPGQAEMLFEFLKQKYKTDSNPD